MSEKRNLEDRTKAKLDNMSLDQKALYISKCLMQAEWAIWAALPDVDALRTSNKCDMAKASMEVLQSYNEIRAAHMRLTRVDLTVNDREIPMAASR